MAKEKELWSKLNSELKRGFDCAEVAGVLEKCNEVLTLMRKIIKFRGKSLKNKKEGIGVRGMRDILGSANLLYGDNQVCSGNFWAFVGVLEAISKLPKGSYPVLAWLWGSALSENTKELCGKAEKALRRAEKLIDKVRELKELLDEDSKLKGKESQKSDEYGASGKWEKVDEMALSKLESYIGILQAEVKKLKVEEEKRYNDRISDSLLHENFRVKREFKDSESQGNVRTEEQRRLKEQERGWDEGQIGANIVSDGYDFLYDRFKKGQKPRGDIGEQEDERFEVQEKLEEQGKKELIGRLVACYEDQNKHIVNNWFGSWPLVTDSVTLSEWKAKDADCYEGEFSIKCSGKKYGICVYNLQCKDYNTKKDFDGPKIIEKLNEWSNKRKDVIVVEGTKDK